MQKKTLLKTVRAIPKNVTDEIVLSDDGSKDNTVHFRIGDIPIPTRYFKEASSINLWRSIRYGILTLIETFKYPFNNY